MKNSILLIICIFVSSSVFSADHYKIGDTLFVWAKSGLNMRAKPNANSEKITDGVAYGESLVIVSLSHIFYPLKINAINTILNKVAVKPLILNGHWVQVKTSKGEIGFVIDQYLLHFQPFNTENPSINKPNLEHIAFDTVFYKNATPNSEGLTSKVKRTYAHNIHSIEQKGIDGTIHSIYFQQSNVEEVYILLSSTWQDANSFSVERTWKESILLSNESCWVFIDKTDDFIIAKIGCSL